MPDVVVNPATPEDVGFILELVAARVPDRHVTPDAAMAIAWHEDLRRYDRRLLQRAALAWDGLRFPAAAEFAEHVAQLARSEFEAERHAANREDLPCPECRDGSGYVVIAEATPTAAETLKPCQVCNPSIFKRWADGHLAPDHDCSECRDLRRGKVAKASRE